MIHSLITFLAAIPLFTLGQQNISSLDSYNNKEITVRGYLHQSKENTWVLTSDPNTPSCCVAAAHTTKEQIFLGDEIEIAPSNQPVTIQGILHFENHHPTFTLTNPKVIEGNKTKLPWKSLSLAIVLIIGIILSSQSIIKKNL